MSLPHTYIPKTYLTATYNLKTYQFIWCSGTIAITLVYHNLVQTYWIWEVKVLSKPARTQHKWYATEMLLWHSNWKRICHSDECRIFCHFYDKVFNPNLGNPSFCFWLTTNFTSFSMPPKMTHKRQCTLFSRGFLTKCSQKMLITTVFR